MVASSSVLHHTPAMISYKVTITGDRYPTEYTVQASGWATAAGRAIRMWKARFKGSRTDSLSIRIVKQIV